MIKEFIESFIKKIEVITDSRAIIYSVRILIVLLALFMGYIHTPKKSKEISTNQLEQRDKSSFPLPQKEDSSINMIN